MHIVSSIFKHILWALFSIIVFILLVGVAKTNRDVGAYIHFLNANDWLLFSRYNPTTWGDTFWPEESVETITDILSGEIIDAEVSGLDVYNPAFEQDLNEFSDGAFSGSTQEDFGFTTGGQNTTTGSSSDADSQSTLLDLIKQRELTK